MVSKAVVCAGVVACHSFARSLTCVFVALPLSSAPNKLKPPCYAGCGCSSCSTCSCSMRGVNKSALCRITSLALSLVLIPTSSDIWHLHLYIRDPASKTQSVLFTSWVALCIQAVLENVQYWGLEGGTPLYGLDGYVPLNRVWFSGSRLVTGYMISLFSVLKRAGCLLGQRSTRFFVLCVERNESEMNQWNWVFCLKRGHCREMNDSCLNPSVPKSDQHEYSPNNISRSSRVKVMRITQLITKGRMLWS